MRSVRALALLAGSVALIVTACGDDDTERSLTGGSSTSGDETARDVDIDMVDNAFEPDTVSVEAGETVRFMFTNTGDVDHDAFIGDADAQADHEDEMRAAEDEDSADDGMGHDMGSEGDEDGFILQPGETGELTHTFTEAGTVEIGCHEPGHYASGMKVTVTVD